MKRLSIVFLAIMLAVSCAHVPKGGSVRPELYNIYSSSISVAMNDGTGEMDVVGSGTIISNKKDDYMVVITAAHVIKGIEKRWAKLIAEKKVTGELEYYIKLSYQTDAKKVRVLRINEEKDLALLQGIEKEKQDGPFVKLAGNAPNIGDPIWVIGAPMGDERTVTNGIVSNFDSSTKVSMYRITAPIFFGNSGGGLFNERMELIGVVRSISSIAGIIFVPGAGFAVSLEEVRKFL